MLAQELLMNRQCSSGSRSFTKRQELLEEEDHSGLPSEVDNHQLRESTKLILLQLYKKLPKNSTLPSYGNSAFWTNWKSEKVNKRVLHELMANQKNHHFEVLSSLIIHNKNHFSIWLGCVTESGCYRTTGDDQLSGWTKKKLWSSSQSQTYNKKGHGLIWWSGYLSDPLQLSDPSETIISGEAHLAINMRCTEKPAGGLPAGIGQQKGASSSPRQCPNHTV